MDSLEQPLTLAPEDSDKQVESLGIHVPTLEPVKATPRLWLVPTLLGALVLLLNVVLPFRPEYRWAYRIGTWLGGSNLILLAVSLFSGLFLIVYAFGLWRFERNLAVTTADSLANGVGAHRGLRFRVGVLVPLALCLVGVSALWLSFTNANARFDPTPNARPCVELYGDALAVTKERPSFRMRAEDPDEIRCGVNQAIFG